MMAAAAFDGVQWRSMASAMVDYDERTRGHATTSQHDERMIGRCNKRTTRDDGETTSWRDETTRGGTPKTASIIFGAGQKHTN